MLLLIVTVDPLASWRKSATVSEKATAPSCQFAGSDQSPPAGLIHTFVTTSAPTPSASAPTSAIPVIFLNIVQVPFMTKIE